MGENAGVGLQPLCIFPVLWQGGWENESLNETAPVFSVEAMLLEVTPCVTLDHFTPEGSCGCIPYDLTHLPCTGELVENVPRNVLTDALMAVFPQDEEFSHDPGILMPGEVVVARHQNKACQIAIHAYQEGCALRLDPIVVEIGIIIETHRTKLSFVEFAEIVLV